MSETESDRAKYVMRVDELVARTGFCRSTIFNLVKRAEFPAGFKVGHARCWRRSEVDQWFAERK